MRCRKDYPVPLSAYWIRRCKESVLFANGLTCYGLGLLSALDVLNDHIRQNKQKIEAISSVSLRQQAASKEAEVRAALLAGADPETHVNWEKIGTDVTLPRYTGGEARADVKHTFKGLMLIWPISKIKEYWDKNHEFDVLVLVTGQRVAGWISKQEFFDKHRVYKIKKGGTPMPGLKLGTWFVTLSKLHDMSELIKVTALETLRKLAKTEAHK
jgi:hypothetical protein